tara:strand:- start:1185 stop:1850 length:666 start_codon:yes stop_codon:yes gene_type:complete
MIKNNEQLEDPLDFISKFEMIVWDFDGVIKDSVSIKTEAFVKLFSPYGSPVINFVKDHHEKNGGMSRFEKIPLYLKEAGIKPNKENIKKFCKDFSNLVVKGVIDSDWIPGVKNFLTKSPSDQIFILATATPQEEILYILDQLNIARYFKLIFGAPTKKKDAILDAMNKYNIISDQVLMIGDSSSDLIAADNNSVAFLLRKTLINKDIQLSYDGPQFNNLKK